MYYVGLDGHKDIAVFCIQTNSGTVKEIFSTSADPKGMDELIMKMKGKRYKVLAEASTYTTDLHDYFVMRGVDSYLANPRKLKLITESNSKTDRNDALELANYLRLWDKGELKLSISYIVMGEDRSLRELCRYRMAVSKSKGETMQKIKAHMRRNAEYMDTENLDSRGAMNEIRFRFGDDFILMQLIDDYMLFDTKGNNLDREIEKMCQHREDVKLLTTIPGIGTTTAAEIMSMIVDIGRFGSADRLRAFFGMAPKVRDSSKTVSHGHITRMGDSMMRFVLGLAVNNHCRFCPEGHIARYKRSHKGAMKAGVLMVACENKLLDLIYVILKRKTPYEQR